MSSFTGWRKSTYSLANGNCVEVAAGSTWGVLVRDSKDPDGPVLAFSSEAWGAWVARIREARG